MEVPDWSSTRLGRRIQLVKLQSRPSHQKHDKPGTSLRLFVLDLAALDNGYIYSKSLYAAGVDR